MSLAWFSFGRSSNKCVDELSKYWNHRASHSQWYVSRLPPSALCLFLSTEREIIQKLPSPFRFSWFMVMLAPPSQLRIFSIDAVLYGSLIFPKNCRFWVFEKHQNQRPISFHVSTTSSFWVLWVFRDFLVQSRTWESQ
jgi:hypothetical protein